MSRSGYSDDCDDRWRTICWRGAVNSAIRGKRGQAFMGELLRALDAIPRKRLVRATLEADGEVCAIGSVLRQRGTPMPDIHEYDWDDYACQELAKLVGVADAMTREIMYENDERGGWMESPEGRWARMRAWVVSQIRTNTEAAP